MHVGAVEQGERALVIDDLVATGGTLSAAIRRLGEDFCNKSGVSLLITYCLNIHMRWLLGLVYVERVGVEVVECACVIGVPEIKVRN